MAITGIEVTYGTGMDGAPFKLKPAPLLSYSLETFRTSSNEIILGGLHRYTLDGTYLPTGSILAGAPELFTQKEALVNAFSKDYQDFKIEFKGTTPECNKTVVCGKPLIESFSISSENNFTTFIKYDVELVFPASSITGTSDYLSFQSNLESASTEFSLETINQPYKYGSERAAPIVQISRNINAKGIHGPKSGQCPADYTSAFTSAMGYVQSAAGRMPPSIATKGMYNVDADNSLFYVTSRTLTSNQEDGTASITDTIIAIPTGGPGTEEVAASGRPGNFAVYDTFSVEAGSELANGLGTITVQGDLQGWTSFSQNVSGQATDNAASGMVTAGTGTGPDAASLLVPFYKGTTAFDNVSGYMNAAHANDLFYKRAETLYSGGDISKELHLKSVLPLKKKPVSSNVSYNIAEGTASYTFTYDNRPSNLNPGALSESISLSRARQIPVHAALTILGRAAGPLFQDIGTKSALTQDLNIEATFVPRASGEDGISSESAAVATGGLWQVHDEAGTGSISIGDVKDSYNFIATAFEGSITGEGGTTNSFFKTQDNETFDPKNARYTRAISYIYVPCTGS